MVKYSKVIRDAVHGDLFFTALENTVMNTRAFQRLRGLRQLGTSHLVYPSATHTRFNHLLGTCAVARRIIHAINQTSDRRKISGDHEQLICLGAMLHDILNLPFGHTIEDEFPIFQEGHSRHDAFESLKAFLEDQSQPIGSLLHEYDPKAPVAVARLIAAKEPLPGIPFPNGAIPISDLGELAYGADIIGNTICADLLDYLARDIRHTGLRYEYDFDRIVQCFDIVNHRLVLVLHEDRIIRRGLLSEILKLLDIRYTLAERVYYHPTKVMASAMVSRAISASIRAHVVTPSELLGLGDDELLYRIEHWQDLARGRDVNAADAQIGERLVRKVRSRELYRPAWDISPDVAQDMGILDGLVAKYWKDPGGRERAEDEIAGFLDLPRGSVLIFCPHNRMSLKEAQARVAWPQMPAGSRLCDVKDRRVEAHLRDLDERHSWLWRMEVFLDPEFNANERDVHAMCMEKFSGDRNLGLALRERRVTQKLIRRGQAKYIPQVLAMRSRDVPAGRSLYFDDLSPSQEDQELDRMVADLESQGFEAKRETSGAGAAEGSVRAREGLQPSLAFTERGEKAEDADKEVAG